MGSITNLKENKSIFIPCDCQNEIMVIEYDHQTNIANISLHENRQSYSNKLSLWQKLKSCYRILMYKKSYISKITLSQKQINELNKFLYSLEP